MRTIPIPRFTMLGLLFITASLVKSQSFCPQLFFKSIDTTVCITLDSIRDLEIYSNSDKYLVQLRYNPSSQGKIDRNNYYSGRILHESIGWTKIADNLYRTVFPKVRINDLRPDFDFTHDTIIAVLHNYPIQEANNCLPFARFGINKVLQAVAFLERDLVVCNGEIQQSIKLESTYTEFYGISWTSDNSSFGLPLSGVDSIPIFTANNTSGTDQIAKISYKPKLRSGLPDACINYPNEFFITASKATKPVFQPDTLNLSACLGELTPKLKPLVRGNVAKTNWAQIGSLYMPSAPFEGVDSIPVSIATLHRPRTYLGSVRFRFQAETPGGCTSDYAEYGITVRPRTAMNPVEDLWICNGVKNPVINFTGRDQGLEYRWTSNNSEFGLPAQGFYNVPTVKLNNPLAKEIQTVIQVSPKFPSRIWVAQEPDTWNTFTGYTYYGDFITDDPGKETFHFSTKGIQIPHPNGHQIFYTDGANKRLQVFCVIPCNGVDGAIPDLPLPAMPQNLSIDSDGNTLYSINYDSSSIVTINTRRWELVQKAQFKTPLKCGAFSPDGYKLYLGVKAQKKIWVLDAHTLAVLDTLQLSGEVESILPFPDGSGLSIKFQDSSSVKLWDLNTRRVVASIAVSKSPKQLINAQRTNKLYIYEEAVYPNQVLVVDLKSRKLLKTLTVKEYIHTDPARKPLKLSVNPLGDLIYINTVPFSVINTYQDSIKYVPGEVNYADFFISDGDCGGEPQQFTLTLGKNQAPPVIDTFYVQRLCAGEKSAPIPLSQRYPGIDFNWVKKYKGANYDLETGKGDIPSIEAPLSNQYVEYPLEFRVNPTFLVGDTVCTIEPFEVNFQIFGKIRPTISLGAFYDRTLTLGQSIPSIFLFKNDPNDFKIRYRWVNDNPIAGIPAEGNGDIPAVTNRNNTSLLQVANISIYAERLSGKEWVCPEVIHRYQLRLLPFEVPQMDSLPDLVVCNADSLPAIAFKSTTKETIFRWRNIGSYVGEPSSMGTGSIPSFQAFNSGAELQRGSFAVRPVVIIGNDSLVGLERYFSIFVKPRFRLYAVQDQHFCSGSINPITLNADLEKLNWSFDKPQLITKLVGSNIVVTNELNTPETGTFRVFGAYPDQTCSFDTQSFHITIYPRPTLPKIENSTICAGETYPGFKAQIIPGFRFQWVCNNPTSGLPNSGLDSIPSFLAAQPGQTPISALINYQLSVAGVNKEVCPNLKSSFQLNVLGTPNIKKTSDQTVLNCSIISIPTFQSDWQNAIFAWENNHPEFGLHERGRGNLPAFFSANPGLEPGQMQIKVSSMLEGFGRTCSGGIDSFAITILPSPGLPTIPDVAFCANVLSKPISLGASASLKKIRWTIDQSIGLPSTGIGDIPSFIPSIFTDKAVAQVRYNFEFPEQIMVSNTTKRTIKWVDPIQQNHFDKFEQDVIPWNMALHPDRKKVYVSRLNGSIDVVNPLSQTIIKNILVKEYCDFASKMLISKDGQMLYLSSELCNYLLVVNAVNDQVENRIEINKPIGTFTQSPRGLRLYLVTQDGNEILVVNPRTYQTVQRIAIGLNVPITNAEVDPSGNKIYLLSQIDNSVFTINLANGALERKRSIPAPNEIFIAPSSNKVYIGSIAGGAYYFDLQEQNNTITYVPYSKSIGTFAWSEASKTLYATYPKGDKIFSIATETGKITDSITVTGTAPYGIVVVPTQTCVAAPNSFQITINACAISYPKTAIDKERLLDISIRQDTFLTRDKFINSVQSGNAPFGVGQNEPNPFGQLTNIPFYIPVSSKVKLTLYNLSGQKVLAIENMFEVGHHSLTIDAKELPGTGVYLARIDTNMGSANRKIIFIHP